MDLGLSDRLVLITGSSAGIGRAIAAAFVAEGARVILNARNVEKLEALQRELGADRTYTVAGDVSDGASAQALAAAVDKIGPLDILVNNVGIFGVKPFVEITDEEWLRYFDVNVVGNVRLIRHFLPGMLERDFGRIVNISSECGVRGFGTMAHYATTKAAQLGLTQSVAALTKGRNVTVNSVLPGPTWTEGVDEYMNGVAQQQGISPEQAAKDYFVQNEPDSLLQRFIAPEEVAQTVVTAVANPAINGASIRVEGGLIRSL
ncbi:3-oxoacyl-[acyl-carrier protein] reductase [Enhygromyxa salina]|uniref:3-oxoacyl-[acyl-carrier protein] reductase n=1 Tax=Enhygromyxa salina TaxID=215803 RepID=A0A0C1Z963_9BACT|nr:SDR family oxidoreductase [Enhygromyxa salina]KIG14134.1 3-oxoacyl-[acyl-carrier protein] reductase [Enhygromyxa salina]